MTGETFLGVLIGMGIVWGPGILAVAVVMIRGRRPRMCRDCGDYPVKRYPTCPRCRSAAVVAYKAMRDEAERFLDNPASYRRTR